MPVVYDASKGTYNITPDSKPSEEKPQSPKDYASLVKPSKDKK